MLKQTLGVAQCGGQANSRLGEESNEALSPSVCGIRKDGTNGNGCPLRESHAPQM